MLEHSIKNLPKCVPESKWKSNSKTLQACKLLRPFCFGTISRDRKQICFMMILHFLGSHSHALHRGGWVLGLQRCLQKSFFSLSLKAFSFCHYISLLACLRHGKFRLPNEGLSHGKGTKTKAMATAEGQHFVCMSRPKQGRKTVNGNNQEHHNILENMIRFRMLHQHWKHDYTRLFVRILLSTLRVWQEEQTTITPTNQYCLL